MHEIRHRGRLRR